MYHAIKQVRLTLKTIATWGRSELKGERGKCEPGVPFALPAPFGHGLQGRVQAVGMVADVAVVTQQQSPWVGGLPTGLAHRALQTPPAFAENHFSDLEGDGSHVMCTPTRHTTWTRGAEGPARRKEASGRWLPGTDRAGAGVGTFT